MSVDFAPVYDSSDVSHFVVECWACHLTDGREYATYADATAAAGPEPVMCPDSACASHDYAERMHPGSVVSELARTTLNVANGNAYGLLAELGFDVEADGIYGSCSAAEMTHRLETHPLSNRHYFERLFEVVRAATALGRDVQWC